MSSLRIRPQLLLTAKRSYLGGAMRLVCIAKNVAPHGWITETDLRDAAYTMGVSRSSFYRWLKEAYSAEFLRYVCDNHGRNLVIVPSYAELYELLELPFWDKQAVQVEAADLFTDHWFTVVWEAWNAANFDGKVISQDTKQRLSGVPVATQRRHDRRAGIRRIRNFVKTDVDASTINVEAHKEFSNRRGLFVMGGKIAFCIPSISVVQPGRVQPIGSKRLRKNISASVRLCSNAEASDGETARIFCVSELQVKMVRGAGYQFVANTERGYNVWRAFCNA